MMVDTLTIARELKAADLPPGQAEAIAAAIGRSIAETAATKADLDLAKQELRADIAILRTEARTEMEKLRTEMERTRNQLLTYIISAMVALSGLVIAVIKL